MPGAQRRDLNVKASLYIRFEKEGEDGVGWGGECNSRKKWIDG